MNDRSTRRRPEAARRRARRGSLRRADERTTGRHVGVGAALVVVAAVITVVSVISIKGLPFTSPYRVEAVVPANAPIVRPGDEVRIAGQPVGVVREVAPTGHGRQVTMEVDQGKVGRDARATVRLRGLAGAVYIELTPGDSADPAPSGWTIPRSHTDTGTQLTDVVAAFDDRTRKGLRRTLTAYGGGIAGRGSDLNATLADLPPTLHGWRPLLSALAPQPGTLAAVVQGLDRTLVGLAGDQPGALGDLITTARVAVGTVASESSALGTAIAQTPPTLGAFRRASGLANPLLDDLAVASRRLSPTVARLDTTLPQINELLSRRQDVDQLAAIAQAAGPTLAAAGPALRRLTPTAETLAPLASAAEPLAAYVARYPDDVIAGPRGFTTWGRFFYDQGQAPGHRAVRFTPVFTCAPGRDPYPAPGQVGKDRMPCPR